MLVDAIDILDSLCDPSVRKRRRRSVRLLKPSQEAAPEDWHVRLPRAFNRALDIQLTERVETRVVGGRRVKKKVEHWTQGSAFAFEAGDTIFVGSDGQMRSDGWGVSPQFALQVIGARPVQPGSREAQRDSGEVTVRILVAGPEGKLVPKVAPLSVTQDQFVRFCVTGQSASLTEAMNR